MNAAEIVIDTIAGRTFRASRRTFAHIEWTIERLAVDYPRAQFVIIQTCYNVGVAASAGTHDKDAVLDVQLAGLSWQDAQTWLREHGWAAWWRYPPTFGNHIHMVSLGYPGEVGIYVPGQVADYYSHRSGLANHVADNTWHPADIDSTIFDYPAWLAAKEDDMFTDADSARLKTLVGTIDQLADAVEKLTALVDDRVRAPAYKRDTALANEIKALRADLAKLTGKGK